ncbi:MAG: hypothetical protein A2W31_11470 [Planctomycetes bacterium RBG_16_64_10]|nr:MAG: hypothetical protein A2W31_11470 [Planctomycetes bacterium RBG_16_64_10]
MPLDGTKKIDEQAVQIIHRFRVVGPVARVRPVQQHGQAAHERIHEMIGVAQQRPDQRGRRGLPAEPREWAFRAVVYRASVRASHS